jgi:hypothetical protein
MNKFDFMPLSALPSRYGANMWASNVGAVRFVSISRTISPAAMLDGSKKLKLLWMPALRTILSSSGKSVRRPAAFAWRAEKSAISN